jgi:hypothetical protein
MILAQNFFAILILTGFALPLLCKHIKHCKETQTTEVKDDEERAWFDANRKIITYKKDRKVIS